MTAKIVNHVKSKFILNIGAVIVPMFTLSNKNTIMVRLKHSFLF